MNKIRSIFLLFLLPAVLFGQQEISNAYLVNNGKLLKNANDEYLTKRTPWVFQTAAAETQLVIFTLNISAGGKVNIDWGDGTSNTYTGINSSITKNYSPAGQYTVRIDFGDYTKITSFRFFSQQILDDISNVNFGNFTNLSSLLLYTNQLSGSIPSEIGNLTNLSLLYLYINDLTGSIPSEIGNLTNLSHLFLFNNQLSGSIPPEIGNLTNLSLLHLHNNQLSGSIPSEIGNLTNLSQLILFNNQLSGSIPSEIGNLTNLSNLTLYTNQLSGSIPDISQMSSLTNAQFQVNSLSGIDSIAPPNNATTYNFSNNNFSSSEVNEVLEDADASITSPTANLTLNVSGSGMGNLTDGAANTFLVSLSGKYTTAGQTLTVLYNTP